MPRAGRPAHGASEGVWNMDLSVDWKEESVIDDDVRWRPGGVTEQGVTAQT
ncbi:hypothetical protein BQ8420_04330 [Nocardiopsis sp. JB363]|nr:hypothetical protein BQ8420_04330 [Nocardiopsis sp. JB363]